MDIEILMLDDDEKILAEIKELLDGERVNGNKIHVTCKKDFDTGMTELKSNKYDIVILDVFKGKPAIINTNQPGKDVFESIRNTRFIPVIFFSGLISEVVEFKSYMVRVVRKSDGANGIKKEIKNLADVGLIFISKDLNEIINESMKTYFWEFVQKNHTELSKVSNASIFRYLLIRRLGLLLSKEAWGKLKNQIPTNDKTDPLQFYIVPPINKKEPYETGDVLEKGTKIFVILTPSCDLVIRKNGEKKAKKVLLVAFTPLKETKEYKKYIKDKSSNKSKNDLKTLIKAAVTDKHFFLPEILFVPNGILNFQQLVTIEEADLGKYTKIAKIDDPYVQAIQATFIRYYNRVGYPDLDLEEIIKNL